MLTSSTEASRAKHKFAVKRNSWPKTRGVAMNPVDHPHGGVSISGSPSDDTHLTVHSRVTTNILVKPLPSTATLCLVKRRVSSLPDGLVCCVVLRRSRIKAFSAAAFWGLGSSDCFDLWSRVQGTKGDHDGKRRLWVVPPAFVEYKKKKDSKTNRQSSCESSSVSLRSYTSRT